MGRRFGTHALVGLSLAVLASAAWPGSAGAVPHQGTGESRPPQHQDPTLAPSPRGSIVVRVRDFRNRDGQLLLAVFASEEGFPNHVEHALYQKAFPIKEDTVKVRIDDLAPGTYAVAIHHDEDGDFEMAKGLFGIPREGYGASNDAPARFGPPKFKHARFELKEGQVLELPIRVRYF